MLMARARPARPRLRPSGPALLAAIGVAFMLHLMVLGGDETGARPPAPIATMTVRTVAPSVVTAPVAAVAPVPAALPPRTPKPKRPVEPPREPAPAAAPAPQALPTVADSADAVEVAGEVVKPVAGPAAPAVDAVPVYRAIPPPPAKLHYEMKRGMFSGNGDLVWKPAGERYELRLEASVAGLHVLTETSDGLFGAQGLAPVRYTDWRWRRGISAANFQRDKGKITYSGPQVEFLLLPGAQDRLSWMLQIGAVLNAEPQHAAPGGKLVFFVTGARGDADTWAFRYAGAETVGTSGGAIRAVKFTREPRQTYDRLVEIWLAPAHQHLPVRARFTAQADGEIFELLLRDIQAP
jgi:hypothetical protein